MAQYDDIIKQYPPVDYIYAMTYNSEDAPKEVFVSTSKNQYVAFYSSPFLLLFILTSLDQKWNEGIRIHFVHNYIHGDDPHYLHYGNCIFTRGTADEESKGNINST